MRSLLWIASVAAAAVGGGVIADQLRAPPAQAQGFGTAVGPVDVAATTVGTVSHVYAVDQRTGQIIFCRAGAMDSKPTCGSAPIPGMATR
jgi:hypothetical protein